MPTGSDAPNTTEALLHEGMERLRIAGSETARLDAQLLLGDALGLGRTAILAHPEAPVGADATARYQAGIQRRAAGEPVAYIRGVKEFYGLALSVDQLYLQQPPQTLQRHRQGHRNRAAAGPDVDDPDR